MQIKPIKTDQDYRQALARLEKIFETRPGSREGDELEILGILIDKYEKDHFPDRTPRSHQSHQIPDALSTLDLAKFTLLENYRYASR